VPLSPDETGIAELRATAFARPATRISYTEEETSIEGGECIIFYTDGLVEAHNAQREMFGFPRLQELIVDKMDDGESLIDRLLASCKRHRRPWEQEDDITLVGSALDGEQLLNDKRYDVMLEAFRRLCGADRAGDWNTGSPELRGDPASQEYLAELQKKASGIPVRFFVNRHTNVTLSVCRATIFGMQRVSAWTNGESRTDGALRNVHGRGDVGLLRSGRGHNGGQRRSSRTGSTGSSGTRGGTGLTHRRTLRSRPGSISRTGTPPVRDFSRAEFGSACNPSLTASGSRYDENPQTSAKPVPQKPSFFSSLSRPCRTPSASRCCTCDPVRLPAMVFDNRRSRRAATPRTPTATIRLGQRWNSRKGGRDLDALFLQRHADVRQRRLCAAQRQLCADRGRVLLNWFFLHQTWTWLVVYYFLGRCSCSPPQGSGLRSPPLAVRRADVLLSPYGIGLAGEDMARS